MENCNCQNQKERKKWPNKYIFIPLNVPKILDLNVGINQFIKCDINLFLWYTKFLLYLFTFVLIPLFIYFPI